MTCNKTKRQTKVTYCLCSYFRVDVLAGSPVQGINLCQNRSGSFPTGATVHY